MDLSNRVIVVTGAAGGIGEALARRFAVERPRALVLADMDGDRLEAVARSLPPGLAEAVAVDLRTEAGCEGLILDAIARHRQVDVVFSNAGVLGPRQFEVSSETWQLMWEINTMAHVHLARVAVPPMLQRGEGYFAGTVSAAGLLNFVLGPAYGVTKAAALSFFEWLSIAYGSSGLRVSCLCPQGVRTRMLDEDRSGILDPAALEPADVAGVVTDAMTGAEPFLILPHPDVLQYFQRKAGDYDRWLRGMRRFRETALRSERDPAPAG